MTVPTTSWNENSPAGEEQLAQGDNRIRELKTQIREVIDVDHDFPSSGQAADVGQHKRVTLQEQVDLGSGAVGTTILGSQTVSGKGELVYTDEDDNDIQLTSGGKIGGASVDVDVNDLIADTIKIDTNNTYITSKNAAGSGTVNLIKADASDIVVIPDGAQTATNAAPTDDKGIVNKKYVDDNIISDPVGGQSAGLKLDKGITGTITAGSYQDVTFTSAFSVAPAVVASFNRSDSNSEYSPLVGNVTTTGCRIYSHSTNDSQPAYWIAVGT